jgi:hypothetical protein
MSAHQLPRTVPTLSIYPDGSANLNLEATALLASMANGIGFFAPKPHRQRAGNPRRPNLWELGCGSQQMRPPGTERGGFRLRVGATAPPPGRYLLTPLAGQPDRFTLVPVG